MIVILKIDFRHHLTAQYSLALYQHPMRDLNRPVAINTKDPENSRLGHPVCEKSFVET